MTKMYLGSISIFVKDRHNIAEPINRILNNDGSLIMSRLGVNVEPKCMSDCLAIICLAVCGPKNKLAALCMKLNRLKGVNAKLNLMR